MSKTLYLHIGLHKTGSSAIQHFLGLNRDALQKMGIIIPGTSVEANLHHDIALLASNKNDIGTAERQLINEIKTITPLGHTFILSAEVFAAKRKIHIEALRVLHDFFSTIHVIVYLRRGDTLLESAYSQRVKTSDVMFPLNPAAFNQVYRLAYINKLNSFAEIFGRQSIVVRPYEKRQFSGQSIFTDFLSCLKLENNWGESLTFPKGRINPSLTLDTLEYKRLLNAVLTPAEAGGEMTQIMIRYSQRQRQSNDDDMNWSILSSSERTSLLNKLESNYATIAKEYLGRADGKLFYDTPADETWKPYPGLQTEKIEAITRFIHEQSPELTPSLYERLSRVKLETDGDIPEKDNYFNAAQETLLPAFERVLKE